MPKWIKAEELEEYVECKDIVLDDLQDLSAEARKVAYQRYGMIAGILLFVDDKDIRAELIEKVAEENDISKQGVRNYLCNYYRADLYTQRRIYTIRRFISKYAANSSDG